MRRALGLIALALAVRAGTRLAKLMGLAASRSSMLRLIHTLSDPNAGKTTVLGVDDLALRRGHRYATVLVDVDTHRRSACLPTAGRRRCSAGCPLILPCELSTRDRAGGYA